MKKKKMFIALQWLLQFVQAYTNKKMYNMLVLYAYYINYKCYYD